MTVDPLEALLETDRPSGAPDKMTTALEAMPDDERATWLAVITGEQKNPANGRPYSMNHIERAMKRSGHDVSVSSIRRYRYGTDLEQRER